MVQSMIVLLVVAYRFGAGAYGPTAGVVLVAAFLGIEALLFWAVSRSAKA